MNVQNTEIPGLLIIEPDVFEDSRGWFFETYNHQRFSDHGINQNFIQDNCSRSTRGVIRGLHYQTGKYSQAKLIQVLKGEALDVAVDLRQNSPTYGEHLALKLSEQNHLQFLIPAGFAHGFSVLSQEVVFSYKCDKFYNRASERGIRFDDPDLAIDWEIPSHEIIVSEKDKILPLFREADRHFL